MIRQTLRLVGLACLALAGCGGNDWEPTACSSSDACCFAAVDWCATIPHGEDDGEDARSTGIALTAAGLPVVAGTRTRAAVTRAFVSGFDPSGAPSWTWSSKGELHGDAPETRVVVGRGGDILVISSDPTEREVHTVWARISSDGEPLNERTLDFAVADLVVDATGHAFGLVKDHCDPPDRDCLYVVRFDADGQELERFEVGDGTSPLGSVPMALRRHGDGSFIVSGRLQSELWLAKYSHSGRRQWQHVGSGPLEDFQLARVLMLDGDIAWVSATTAGAVGVSPIYPYDVREGTRGEPLVDLRAYAMVAAADDEFLVTAHPDESCDPRVIDRTGAQIRRLLPSGEDQVAQRDCPAITARAGESSFMGGRYRDSSGQFRAWIASALLDGEDGDG